MKTILFILAVVLLFACRQGHVVQNNHALITGTIKNQTTDFVMLCGTKVIKEGVADSIFVDEHGQYTIAFGTVNGNGHFALSARIDEAGFYYLRHESWWNALRFFLSPGDSLSITFDSDEKDIDESIQYSGKGAAINNYLLQKARLSETFPSGEKLYILKKDAFINTTDSLVALKIDQLNKFLDTAGDVSQKFIVFEKANIHYTWLIQRVNYPERYKSYTSDTAIDLGNDYDAYLNKFNFSDSTLLELTAYREALEEYLLVKLRGLMKQDSDLKKSIFPDLMAKMKLIPELFSSPAIKNYLLYETIREQMREYGIYKSEIYLAEFKKQCENRDYVASIERKMERLKNLGVGKPAPLFTYNDINGKPVSLSDFRGKYLYLDVWATWCGPCMEELPYLEKLQKEFKDKNIVFISISIDEDKEAWKKMVSEKRLGGVQLIAPDGWKASVMKDYKIRGIPRFILIDREGTIIDQDASRPSGPIRNILNTMEGIEV